MSEPYRCRNCGSHDFEVNTNTLYIPKTGPEMCVSVHCMKCPESSSAPTLAEAFAAISKQESTTPSRSEPDA